MESDKAYFTRRAADEHTAAGIASDERARQVHLELASRYADLATAIGDSERHLGLVLSDAA